MMTTLNELDSANIGGCKRTTVKLSEVRRLVADWIKQARKDKAEITEEGWMHLFNISEEHLKSKFEKQFPSLKGKGFSHQIDIAPAIRCYSDAMLELYCLDKQKVKHLFAQIRGLLSNPVSLPPELTKYLSEFEDVNLK